MNRQIVHTLAAVVFCAGVAVPAGAQQVKSDNTSTNAADRGPQKVTAEQQENDKADLDITRQVRKALVADKSLSTYAHNIKVITQHGKVTLKGPVRTASEKQAVEAKAEGIAGAGNVTSQLTIAPAKARTKSK